MQHGCDQPPRPCRSALAAKGLINSPLHVAGHGRDVSPRQAQLTFGLGQALYVSEDLKSGRVMVKDEDVCLHCGLCAERCPTGAWDMQKFLLNTTKAGAACRDSQLNENVREMA